MNAPGAIKPKIKDTDIKVFMTDRFRSTMVDVHQPRALIQFIELQKITQRRRMNNMRRVHGRPNMAARTFLSFERLITFNIVCGTTNGPETLMNVHGVPPMMPSRCFVRSHERSQRLVKCFMDEFLMVVHETLNENFRGHAH